LEVTLNFIVIKSVIVLVCMDATISVTMLCMGHYGGIE